MKRLIGFFRWITICLIVAAFLVLYYLEDTLPISQTDHTLIAGGLLVVLFISVFAWINHNEANFLVSSEYLEKLSAKYDKKAEMEKK